MVGDEKEGSVDSVQPIPAPPSVPVSDLPLPTPALPPGPTPTSIKMPPAVCDLNNRVRTDLFPLLPKAWIGRYYTTLHYRLIRISGVILLFSNNILYLTLMSLIIVSDGACIVTLHNCPLTQLEQRYIQQDAMSSFKATLAGADLMYDCNHVYESQLEFVINLWCLVALKMLVLVLMRTFKFTSV